MKPGRLLLAAVAVALASVVLPAAAAKPTSGLAPEKKLAYGWSWPTWSPHGTIAFTGGSVGPGGAPGKSVGIFVANQTGKHLRRVAVVKLGGFPQPLQDMTWAPRDTKLVWDHRFGEAPNKVRIFVADTRRGGMIKIARGMEPAWAPRGRVLAYKGFPGIHLIRPDGRGDRLLTRGAFDGSPSWSPDGRYLVFTRRATLTGDGPIYVDPQRR